MSSWFIKQLHYQAQASHLHESRLRLAGLLLTRETDSTLTNKALNQEDSATMTAKKHEERALIISICDKTKAYVGRKQFTISLLDKKWVSWATQLDLTRTETPLLSTPNGV